MLTRLPLKIYLHFFLNAFNASIRFSWQASIFGRSKSLLYLSVSTHAVIGQFSGPYSPIRPTKIKVVFVTKLFLELSQCVLNMKRNIVFDTHIEILD